MKYLFIFIACCSFSSYHVCAQKVEYGAELGVNVSGAFVKDPGGDPHGSPLPGLQLGAYADLPLSPSGLAVEARLLYSSEGYKPVIYDTKASVRVSFLKIPVNIILKPADKDAKWKFGLGPFFALGIGGHYKREDVSADKIKINFGNDPDNDDLKRMDIGADLMAGYTVNNNLMVRAALDFGLINYLTPGSTANASAHSLSLGITLVYTPVIK